MGLETSARPTPAVVPSSSSLVCAVRLTGLSCEEEADSRDAERRDTDGHLRALGEEGEVALEGSLAEGGLALTGHEVAAAVRGLARGGGAGGSRGKSASSEHRGGGNGECSGRRGAVEGERGKERRKKKRGFSAVFPQRANMEQYDHQQHFMQL